MRNLRLPTHIKFINRESSVSNKNCSLSIVEVALIQLHYRISGNVNVRIENYIFKHVKKTFVSVCCILCIEYFALD